MVPPALGIAFIENSCTYSITNPSTTIEFEYCFDDMVLLFPLAQIQVFYVII